MPSHTPRFTRPARKPERQRSRTVYDGLIRATTRSFLLALGQSDAEIARPHIGVFHTGGEMSPCNLNLAEQARTHARRRRAPSRRLHPSLGRGTPAAK